MLPYNTVFNAIPFKLYNNVVVTVVMLMLAAPDFSNYSAADCDAVLVPVSCRD